MSTRRIAVTSALAGTLVLAGVGVAVAQTPLLVAPTHGKALGDTRSTHRTKPAQSAPILITSTGAAKSDEVPAADPSASTSSAATTEDETPAEETTPSTSTDADDPAGSGISTPTLTATPKQPPTLRIRITREPTPSPSDGAPTEGAPAVTSTPVPLPVESGTPSPDPTPTDATPAPTPTDPAPTAPTQSGVPQFDHVVVVVEENHSYSEVAHQPYLNSLIAGGASFTAAHAETHPSQPNYIDLWAGQDYGVKGDGCTSLSGDNLGAQLLAAGKTVGGYSESLPGAGSTTCTAGAYAKKHDPLATFTQTASAATNMPFSAFPSDYSTLPAVSLVVPNLNNDMHDGSVATGDVWLRSNLSGYARWAATHNSLLVVTFDEDDRSAGNQILNVFSGAHVKPGAYGESVSHYSDLATIEASFGLKPLTSTAPITDVWQ